MKVSSLESDLDLVDGDISGDRGDVPGAAAGAETLFAEQLSIRSVSRGEWDRVAVVKAGSALGSNLVLGGDMGVEDCCGDVCVDVRSAVASGLRAGLDAVDCLLSKESVSSNSGDVDGSDAVCDADVLASEDRVGDAVL